MNTSRIKFASVSASIGFALLAPACALASGPTNFSGIIGSGNAPYITSNNGSTNLAGSIGGSSTTPDSGGISITPMSDGSSGGSSEPDGQRGSHQNVPLTPVPEFSSIAMLITGLPMALGGALIRRRKTIA